MHSLSNVKCKASSHFRNKREYLKDKICGPETNVRTEVLQISYIGTDEFNKWYKPGTCVVSIGKVICFQCLQ